MKKIDKMRIYREALMSLSGWANSCSGDFRSKYPDVSLRLRNSSCDTRDEVMSDIAWEALKKGGDVE